LYIGVALTTTAVGTLLPILRDAGELTTPFGRHVLAAGAAYPGANFSLKPD
jgi:Kef-type K+ transport system membrane component KefB